MPVTPLSDAPTITIEEENQTVTVVEDEAVVQILEETASVTSVGIAGPPGPAGSSANDTYTYYQSIAAGIWVIDHNLGRYPSVTVVDTAGTTFEPDVHYNSANQLTLSFGAAFTGYAYLN